MSLGSTIDLAAQRLAAPVEGMHRAIAGRWFGALGDVAAPVRIAHDVIAGVVYGSIRVAGTAIGMGVDKVVGPGSPDGIQSFVNGLWGDGLDRHHERIGFAMAVCGPNGAAVPIGPGLASAFPDATHRLVMFVHGLIESDTTWRTSDLVRTIEASDPLTPVMLRYNSGLRISENGEQLSRMLAELDDAWPVAIDSIALVGHSMGGLVARSACQVGLTHGLPWTTKVSDIVTMGTPHRGAPLEKFANVAAWALSVAPETRPLAEFINGRSAGIKDLRFGAIAEKDWANAHPDALLRNTVGDHLLPDHIRHHFVAGVVTDDPDHPLGALVGDLMVRRTSATGHPRLEPTNVVTLGGLRHSDLRHDPRVIRHVMEWLAP
ncbi:MAG TPA: hypothetical protein VLG28_01940 [Acidimicrobiia bacterium]|jgi:pimeloyl-ACP methyl ester carboxylesterase|nr:hypothetical protein [Acidimicrobiia bacterium]